MKKYISLLTGVCIAFFLSCEKDEIGGSATQKMAGEWYVMASLLDDGGNVLYESSLFLMATYNSAANVADEIWIDDSEEFLSMKCKFKFTGNASSFTTDKSEVENEYVNLYIYSELADDYAPFTSSYAGYFPEITAAGQLADGIQEYTHVILEEGKITPNGATTAGGHIVDGISLKIACTTDYVTFVSYELDEEDWEDPLVPEYAWMYQAGSNIRTTDMDQSWVIEGHRYTGFAED